MLAANFGRPIGDVHRHIEIVRILGGQIMFGEETDNPRAVIDTASEFGFRQPRAATYRAAGVDERGLGERAPCIGGTLGRLS